MVMNLKDFVEQISPKVEMTTSDFILVFVIIYIVNFLYLDMEAT